MLLEVNENIVLKKKNMNLSQHIENKNIICNEETYMMTFVGFQYSNIDISNSKNIDDYESEHNDEEFIGSGIKV
jgi:hypothetical protein